MSSEQVVAVREGAIIQRVRETPAEAVAKAREQAQELMKIVKETNISKKIGDKEHLQVEAWQTIANFNRCWIDTDWTRDIKDSEGRVLGVEARARLVRLDDGVVLGGAEGACMMDEELERQDGTVIERWSDYYAVKSMAQTRAQGKVGRMAFAWVAVLGGYATTPAEEMTGVQGPRVPFGKDKGKLVSELTVAKDISWLADAVSKSLSDPAKARFKPANERLHAALTARLAELTAPAASSPDTKEAPEIPPTPGAAVAPSWQEKLYVEVEAVRSERDPQSKGLRETFAEFQIKGLAELKTQADGVRFFAAYLKRTGKPKQEGLPV